MSIIVFRLSSAGVKLSESKPCENCLASIKASGIKWVHYSTRNGVFETEKAKDM
jgi:deoxycytidylate deaminase